VPSLEESTPVSNNLGRGNDWQPTEVLNILISSQHQRTLLLGPSIKTSPVGFVDNNTICCGCRNKCETIRCLSPSGIIVEGDVGEDVSEDGEQQGQMSAGSQQVILSDVYGTKQSGYPARQASRERAALRQPQKTG
jgi:hypothetical protein